MGNEETPKNDLIEYAERYGVEALGYAILNLCKENEFTPDWNLVNGIWEYGGNTGNN